MHFNNDKIDYFYLKKKRLLNLFMLKKNTVNKLSSPKFKVNRKKSKLGRKNLAIYFFEYNSNK